MSSSACASCSPLALPSATPVSLQGHQTTSKPPANHRPPAFIHLALRQQNSFSLFLPTLSFERSYGRPGATDFPAGSRMVWTEPPSTPPYSGLLSRQSSVFFSATGILSDSLPSSGCAVSSGTPFAAFRRHYSAAELRGLLKPRDKAVGRGIKLLFIQVSTVQLDHQQLLSSGRLLELDNHRSNTPGFISCSPSYASSICYTFSELLLQRLPLSYYPANILIRLPAEQLFNSVTTTVQLQNTLWRVAAPG